MSNAFKDMYDFFETLPQFPYIDDKPKKHTWYRVPLKDCLCGNGAPYYFNLKIGTQKGLIINFNGGGVAWDDYTASRPMGPENFTGNGFYFDRCVPISDPATDLGILSKDSKNAFYDWSVICINYTSGDFHVGASEVHYLSVDGQEKTLYHHGYKNVMKSLEKALSYLPEINTLIICGESAGGFAVYALAEDIMDMFRGCKKILLCSDGSHLEYDCWQWVAERRWKAQKHIVNSLVDKNYTLGCMLSLYQKYGDAITYMYVSSTRDAALGDFQCQLNNEPRGFSRHCGDQIEVVLKRMIHILKKEIPNCGLFIYDELPYADVPKDDGLTLHTILLSEFTQSYQLKGVSVEKWLKNAVEGCVQQIVCDTFMED